MPPEALVEILQRALEEQGSALMNERLKEEDGILSNRQLREGQDAAYQEALREDKVFLLRLLTVYTFCFTI